MTSVVQFGTDGWRGMIADDFTMDNVCVAAQGVANYLRRHIPHPLAIVGYDYRFGSEVFAGACARIFAGNGIRTVMLDRASPTQAASWTVIDRKAAGALVITASHNPHYYNGIKYRAGSGQPAPTETTTAIQSDIALVESEGGLVRSADAKDPLIEIYDPWPAYRRQVARMIDLATLEHAGLRVVHEVMHGSGAGYVGDLVGSRSGTRVLELHAERNVYFGGVNPEPLAGNLRQALALMASGGYDLAICTDGDADRLAVIDESGLLIEPMQAYALLMRYLFDVRGYRGPIVKATNMSSIADRLACHYRVPCYEVPVGFKNVAHKMMETAAVLGGEESGGYGFRGHMPERDGILAGLMFADMVVRNDRPLSQMLRDLKGIVGDHAYGRHDIPIPRDSFEAHRRRVFDALTQKPPLELAGHPVARIGVHDGLKYWLADGGWVLLRASGTEAMLRVFAEAESEEDVSARITALEEVAGLAP